MPLGFPWSVLYVSGSERGRKDLARGLGGPVESAEGLQAVESRLEGGARPRAVVVRPPIADGTVRAVCARVRDRDPGIDCFVVNGSSPGERIEAVAFDPDSADGWSRVAAAVRHSVVRRSQAPYPVPDGEDRRCSAAAGVLEPARASDRPDAVAREAVEAAGTPHAIVGLITHRREHVVGRAGRAVPGPLDRASTICTHTIAAPETLVVPDRRADARFADLAVPAQLGIEAYAGAPVEVRGERVGTLCVYADAPRSFERETRARLVELAGDLGSHLEALRDE
jgi:GAF domain-containing protein